MTIAVRTRAAFARSNTAGQQAWTVTQARILAGGKAVPLASKDHSLVLNAEAVAVGAQTDLDETRVCPLVRRDRVRKALTC